MYTTNEYIHLIIQALVGICVLAVLLAVLTDFLLYDRRAEVKKGKRSIVRTSTMLLFFFAYYLVIYWKWGVLAIDSQAVRLALEIAGLLLVVAGAGFNILGRLKLNQNWGNNIKIYQDHTLVTTGPFGLVRHPLYASLIWMFFGGSLIYRNYLGFLLNLLVFIPFMTYRARQEETLLAGEFAGYAAYRQQTGMFFPRPWKRKGSKANREDKENRE